MSDFRKALARVVEGDPIDDGGADQAIAEIQRIVADVHQDDIGEQFRDFRRLEIPAGWHPPAAELALPIGIGALLQWRRQLQVRREDTLCYSVAPNDSGERCRPDDIIRDSQLTESRDGA